MLTHILSDTDWGGPGSLTRADVEDPDRLYVFGLLTAKAGDVDVALACLTRASSLAPHRSEILLALSKVMRHKGHHLPATCASLSAIARDGAHAQSLCELGHALRGQHFFREAAAIYSEALACEPATAAICGFLGDALLAQGLTERAMRAYERGTCVAPDDALAWLRLGKARLGIGEPGLALDAFHEGLRLAEGDRLVCDRALPDPASFDGSLAPPSPDWLVVELHVGIGRAEQKRGRLRESLAALRDAVTLNPGHLEASRLLVLLLEWMGQPRDAAGAWVALGNILATQGRHAEAATAYEQALARQSNCLRALVGLGRALVARGQPRAAIPHLDAAVNRDDGHAAAHTELGRALFAAGEIDRAWDQFLWFSTSATLNNRGFEQPLWGGSALVGKTLLIWADQALGDTIHWLRYVPLVRHLAHCLVLEAQPRLVPIVARSFDTDIVVARGTALPHFDVHVPITMLPVVWKLGRRMPTVAMPYLFADTRLEKLWAERVASGSTQTRVGLCWAGHPEGLAATARFATLSDFAPVAGVHGVRFISLQMGRRALEVCSPPADMTVEWLQDDRCSIDDTAALMQSLDLVITVDTMIAHLAGALGRPTWLVLAASPEWRWSLDKEGSTLYPTMRVFRQPQEGDWASVFRRIRDELVELRRMSGEAHTQQPMCARPGA